MIEPTFSVCIPTYNGEKYIEEAILSVLSQTYQDFELIIVDDASFDNTVNIIESINDPRVRLIRNQQNIGMVENWNLCLSLARGKFIKVLCHDDKLDSNCLENHYKIFTSQEDVVAVFNATTIINQLGQAIYHRRPFKRNRIFDGRQLAKKSFRTKNIFGEPTNVTFRKSASELVGPFDVDFKYAIDWFYWMKLSLCGKVYYIDEYLTSFRVSNISATSSLMSKKGILDADDRLFVNKCSTLEDLQVNASDIMIHRVNIACRTVARELFFIFSNQKKSS